MRPEEQTAGELLRENEELRSALARLEVNQGEQLRQFLYAASHDLQEPLRAILAYSELLERQLAGEPAAREFLPFIIGGANRMKDLLQHMAVYSRAGSAKGRAEISLSVPLERALLKLAPEIQFCAARIVRQALPEAVMNESEIAQVFENVIGNSLKFRGEEELEIVISAEQGSDGCTVSVRDNGLGIEPRFCQQALLPFKRLHNSHIPGSGLGLAICDKIMRAHNGRIWLESDGSHGATVRFTLPI
jgi:signal transduction histidine kinase